MVKNEKKVNIAILGFGQEGKAIFKYLKKSPQYKNTGISILDKKTNKNYLKNLNRLDIIFRSPGVPYNLSEIQKAIKNGVKFSSSTDLFFQNAKKIGCKIIGITGTKGKGTTSTLLYQILKSAKKDVYLAGNIGKPAIELLPKIKKKSIVILELSSFQLQDLNPPAGGPDIAVILDIFPDHLDAHKNLKEYFEAKSNIAKWQKKSDKIFYFDDSKRSKLIAEKSPAKKISVKNYLKNFNFDLKIPGKHNLKNSVMAATIAKNLGIDKKIILKTIKNFKGVEHRLEFVRQIGNIIFYNDSASTNPYTAAAAIKAFSEPKVLIAGGKDKNLDYSPFAKALKNSNTKLIILFGENKKKIEKAVVKSGIPVKLIKTLKNAVNLAYQKSKNYNLKPKNYILFSPASASFDMFKDYKDRGEKFKKMVRKLK